MPTCHLPCSLPPLFCHLFLLSYIHLNKRVFGLNDTVALPFCKFSAPHAVLTKVAARTCLRPTHVLHHGTLARTCQISCSQCTDACVADTWEIRTLLTWTRPCPLAPGPDTARPHAPGPDSVCPHTCVRILRTPSAFRISPPRAEKQSACTGPMLRLYSP